MLFSMSIILQCLLVAGKHIYYVTPSTNTKNCPKPCLSLKTCIKQPNSCFKPDVELHFLSKTFALNHGALVINVNNLSLLAASNQSAVFSCSQKGGYLAFNNCENITISNIIFKGCGKVLRSITSFTALPVTFRKALSSSLVMNNCTSVYLNSITFENSYGHAMILINPRKVSIIDNITFTHTKSLYSEDVIFAGMIVYVSDMISNKTDLEDNLIILNNSRFLNYDGYTEYHQLINLDYMRATGLSVFIKETVNRVRISVHNTIFANCTCFNGPLVEISLVYSASSTIQFCNVILLSNIQGNGNQGIKLQQIFYGYRNLSSIPIGHTVIFDHLTVSNNTKFIHVLQLSLVGDKKSLIRLKAEKLPFNLFITKSCFISNKVEVSLWKLDFSINTISLPAMINIKDSEFTSNSNSLMDITYITKLEFSGHNIFHNNTADFELLVSTHSNLYFSGYNEFSHNTIFGSSLLKLNKFTMSSLNEDTSLAFNNNYFVENSTESVVAIIVSSKVCSEQFCACLIQFESQTNFHNYSLTVKNNKASNVDNVKILYRRNLKDCYWLPGSAFSSLHPGEVTKGILQYDNNYANPTGYPFNICLCHKAIDCLGDTLVDYGVYPGQTLQMGFILVDTDQEDIEVDLIVEPIDKVQVTPCEVDLSQISQPITTKCSPVTYTLLSSNESLKECSLQLQHQLVLSVYYVTWLPCPPGFIFITDKCKCDPTLNYIASPFGCNIDNQSVVRPANSWMSYASSTKQILYIKSCPFQYCLPSFSFLQLLHPDQQCQFNRTGVLCGECSNGLSSVFGSSRCKRCTNTWLALIPVFTVVGFLLVLLLFVSRATIKDGNINGFILYVNILSINSYNIFANESIISKQFSYILTSLANLDLGFELCFYNGMTEYGKAWLQLAFPVYLLSLAVLIIQTSKYISRVQRLTRSNAVSVLATLFVLSYSKILLVTCNVLFFYTQLISLPNKTRETFWSVDTSIALFGVKYTILFITCLVILVFIILPLNSTLLFPRLSYRIKWVNYFKPLLDVYHEMFKDKHRYWFGLELVLRVLTFVITALDTRLSLLLNILILALFVAYLSLVQPFKALRNTIIEWSFLMNLILILALAFYYEGFKTGRYFAFLNVLVIIAFLEFSGIILCPYITRVLKPMMRLCKSLPIIKGNHKTVLHENEMAHYKNLNIPDKAFNYTKFQDEILGID